jgi:hypothetical protein
VFCVTGTPFHKFRSNPNIAVNSTDQPYVSGHDDVMGWQPVVNGKLSGRFGIGER